MTCLQVETLRGVCDLFGGLWRRCPLLYNYSQLLSCKLYKSWQARHCQNPNELIMFDTHHSLTKLGEIVQQGSLPVALRSARPRGRMNWHWNKRPNDNWIEGSGRH